jgi:hypothetical protein
MAENNQSTAENPQINLSKTTDYRTGYANSVQVRLSMWDFLLIFGTLHQNAPEVINVENFQEIYVSPQQAKALYSLLGQNLAQYEAAFGTISLDAPRSDGPQFSGPRPVQ